MSRLRTLAPAFCALAASSAVPCFAAPGYDLDFGLQHEDNVTRAEAAADREQDTALEAGGHVSGRSQVRAQDTLAWELGFGATWWTRYNDLSELSGDAALRYRHTFASDFEAPWLELVVGAGALKFKDSDIRDGGQARAGLVLGRRIGARLDARLGYAYHLRRAAEDKVFDLEQHEAFGQLDLQINTRWLLYGGIAAREGELISTAGVPNDKIRDHANAITREPDAAFGRGPSPLGIGTSPRRTYQIDGVALNGELGLNYLLGAGLALDLAAGYVQAHAAGDNQYKGYRLNASLLWQFH